MSLNQILFRSSSGVVRREDIKDKLERRVFDIVASTQEDGIEREIFLILLMILIILLHMNV